MAQYKSLKSWARAVERNAKKTISKKRSLIASTINKELTATRKEITESMMAKTGLKRKVLNDRLSISRANPKEAIIEGAITPLYGKRIYMSEYPFTKTTVRGGRTAIRLLSPIYRKNMRTGFMSADGSRMYLRHEASGGNGGKSYYVRAVRGRSVPRLFDEFGMKERYQDSIIARVLEAVKRAVSP